MQQPQPTFFITGDNKIYKKRLKHNDWILVSPNYKNKKRYLLDDDILLLSGKFFKAEKARPLLNKIWREYDPVWEYKGKKYTSITGLSIYDKKVPRHFISKNYNEGFVLVMYNGEIKWADISNCKFPRIQIFDVNNSENKPRILSIIKDTYGNLKGIKVHGGWANENYCKPIKCLDDNKIM